MKNKIQKYRLRIPSLTDNLQIIREFVVKIADKAGFNQETQEQIVLAVDEACTNVIKHAYKYNAKKTIEIVLYIDLEKMKIIISDKGTGFDISKVKEPDLKKYIKESRHNGLGIYLMRTLMDEVNYIFKPGTKNQVEMIKYLEKPTKVTKVS
jgi:serine/threonine-protein kinase RsbW